MGLGTGIAEPFPVKLESALDLGNYHSSLMGQNNPSEIPRCEASHENISLLLFLLFLITRNSNGSCFNHREVVSRDCERRFFAFIWLY